MTPSLSDQTRNTASAKGVTQRICLTPTRNEAWILPKFLRAASLWADRIIIADQGSEDATREIAADAAKAELIVNDNPEYDESYRTRLLLKKAREHSGKRILIALDADEALSANFQSSPEWKKIADARPGTILRFKWVNILPGFERAWVPPNRIACGYIDDGCDHTGTKIHSLRVPHPPGAPIIDLEDIVVLHFQYMVWERMESKQRWYQAWEWLKHPQKGPLQIFRQYNHMFGSWNPSELVNVESNWVRGLRDVGADYMNLQAEAVTWWDRALLQMLDEHGVQHFRRIAIWGHDWQITARRAGVDLRIQDPRSPFERVAHSLLSRTQGRRNTLPTRALEFLLRRTGW